MEKQYNINIKDYLIKETAPATGHSKEICERLIMWAYKDARDATQNCLSVELSGFGTLILSGTKCERRLKKLALIKERLLRKVEITGNQELWQAKLDLTDGKITIYTEKLNKANEAKLERNKRRVDQPLISKEGNGGVDKQDIPREIGDLQNM